MTKTGIKGLLRCLPNPIFSQGSLPSCTRSPKTTQTWGKLVVMKFGTVRNIKINIHQGYRVLFSIPENVSYWWAQQSTGAHFWRSFLCWIATSHSVKFHHMFLAAIKNYSRHFVDICTNKAIVCFTNFINRETLVCVWTDRLSVGVCLQPAAAAVSSVTQQPARTQQQIPTQCDTSQSVSCQINPIREWTSKL